MKDSKDLTILITGGTDGIGKLTALRLAKLKATLLVHGRNPDKVKRVVEELKAASDNEKIEAWTADFASLDEVRRLAREILEKHDRLDLLINNAGVGSSDPVRSRDGYELRFAVNYLAPFLLTHLLLPALKKAAPARVVNVSSAGQRPIQFGDIMFEKEFDAMSAYCQSKLALIMFTMDLAEACKEDGIQANSLHPGTYLDTNMVRGSGIQPWGKPETGAEAEVFLATSPDVAGITGKYFDGKKEARALEQAYDGRARNRLRELALRLTGLEKGA